MPKNQTTAAKKARTAARAGAKYTGARRAAAPEIPFRLEWDHPHPEHWATAVRRADGRVAHYALVIHGDWHPASRGQGRSSWYLHEMQPDGQIRHDDDHGDELEGWWMADERDARDLARHPELIRTAELHINGWRWTPGYPDGSQAMTLSTYENRRPLAELLVDPEVGPWRMPDGRAAS